MYANFLSFNLIQKYLQRAVEMELLYIDSGNYVTTSKGLEFLKHFEDLHAIADSFMEKRRSLSAILNRTDTYA